MYFFQQKGKKKSADLRALAESWGCKVLSLSELLKELRKLKPLPKKEDHSKKSPVVKGNTISGSWVNCVTSASDAIHPVLQKGVSYLVSLTL